MDIHDAIEHRLEIEFSYDGHLRIVQPAAVGTHKTTGNPILRAYQVAGGSNSGQVPFWKLFLLENAEDLQVTSRFFPSDPPGYQRGDSHIDVEREL